MRPKSNPRRVRVERSPGVYYRLDRGGERVYEIKFTDSEGRGRWETVRGGLRDAVARRAEIVGRKHRGERVASTRRTFAEVADDWLAAKAGLRERTRIGYEIALRRHLVPALGRKPVARISEDDVARLVRRMEEEGLSAWTIRGRLVVLSGVLGYAARRGLVGSNVVRGLDRSERPRGGRREMRILDRHEIGTLLDAADPAYRALLATAIFSGLRRGELLGLLWREIDFEAETIRVRRALDHRGRRVAPKTGNAEREVVLMPALARILRAHRLASPHSRDEDFVFAAASGRPRDGRNVARRGLESAVRRAGLGGDDRPRLRFHDLRHTFASLLVSGGANVGFVSRQLGHASSAITLGIYEHAFAAAEHADRTRATLEAEYGALLR